MNRIRVALIDDYEVVVRGLDSMLRSYRDRIDIVELDANVTTEKPVDIALYDTFAGLQGHRESVRRLAGSSHVGKVVVYSWNVDPSLIAAAIDNGAGGYVSKELPAAQLVDAITAIHEGRGRVFTGESEKVRVVGGDWPGREEGLTPREAEVLALITQGMTNEEIVDRTSLSINSVKTYIRSCYRRIGVTDRANAILWGIDHGFRPDRVRIHERN